eukprot:NODE_88_length_3867_cov_76.307425_g71_i1.p1 GENE.NODE_88_length_3867_cov_76.307425_g71_i1~~NODE_88_length_3867_cov_76.307425_g71_i1.p1  ORF type:complete len:1257 (-),score=366.66 NODE_88_length_3867_cov_76.307425_g71_i1:96-3656(-)
MEEGNKTFIQNEEQRAIIDEINSSLIKAAEDSNRLKLKEEQRNKDKSELGEDELEELARDDSDRIFNAEIVQEKAQEKEQQREAVIEIEKEEFVDRMYCRDHEDPTRWPFESLKQISPPANFYAANTCALHMRKPISFPDSMYISDNYFDKRWSGDRRLKNVVCILEWVPRQSNLRNRDNPFSGPPNSTHEELIRTLKLLLLNTKTGTTGDITYERLNKLIDFAFDLRNADIPKMDKLTQEQIISLVCGHQYRQEHENRYFIALSLAEAETLRRVIHLKAEQPIFAGFDVGMALRCLPGEFHVMDSTWRFEEPSYPPVPLYHSQLVHQSFRFLDCDIQYQEQEINLLLKAIQKTTRQSRRVYFRQMLSCRRRIQKDWDTAPVIRVFELANEFQLLHQRVQSLRVREGLQEHKVSLYDAFHMFNASRSGLLSMGEVNGALHFLNLKPTQMDIIDFVESADTDKDGKLSYNEFWEAVCDPERKLALLYDEEEPEALSRQQSLKPETKHDENELPVVEPKGEQELVELKRDLVKQRELADLQELKRQEEEDNEREIEVERLHDEEERLAGRPPNPHPYEKERPKVSEEEEKQWQDKKKKERQKLREKAMRGFSTGEEQTEETTENTEENAEEKENADKPEEPQVPVVPVEMIPYKGSYYNFTTGKYPKKVVQYGYTEYKKVEKKMSYEELNELKASKLLVGKRVLAKKPNEGWWGEDYWAKITVVIPKVEDGNKSWFYGVLYDDGESWDECPMNSLRLPNKDQDGDDPLDDGATSSEVVVTSEVDDGIPRKIVLWFAQQGFLKMPFAYPSPKGNGGGQNLNQYTIQFVMAQPESFYGGAILFKNSLDMTIRVMGQMIVVDNLGWSWNKDWMKDSVEWSYKKNEKFMPFSTQQTEQLEKEYKKNSQGSAALQMEKNTMFCDFAMMKMRDDKGATFQLKRMDADARWKERFANFGFTDEVLQKDPSVDWLTKLKSTTDWDDEDKPKVDPYKYYWEDDDNMPRGEYKVGAWRKNWKKKKGGEDGEEGSKKDDSDSDTWSIGSDDSGYWKTGGSYDWFDDWGKQIGKTTRTQWHHICITVNIGESARLITYVDGVESKNYRSVEKLGKIDGDYSLVIGDPIYVFGGLNVESDELRGGLLMNLDIADYVASPLEVEKMAAAVKEEISQWELAKLNKKDEEDDEEDEGDNEEYDE